MSNENTNVENTGTVAESQETVKQKKKRVDVTDQLFIEVWTKHATAENGTIQDVVDELGMARGSVEGRATRMRRTYGIPLPNFTRGGGGGKRTNRDEALKFLAEQLGVDIETLRKQGDELKAESASKKENGEDSEQETS